MENPIQTASGNVFRVPFLVRDYECDLQGIVNNAVHLHYLEHARHVFLKSRGVDFPALSAQGVNLVMVRAEIEYKKPLLPGEEFEVTVRTEPQGRLCVVFVQESVKSDGTVAVRARMTGTAIDASGRPRPHPELWSKILG